MTTDDQPTVAAIITTKDRRHFLAEALESVFGQTYPALEVIVVDDGSTDGTPQMLREQYPDRVKLILGGGLGCGGARNLGVQASHAPYIAFLDDDDLWEPYKTERQMAALREAAPDVALVAGSVRFVHADGAFSGAETRFSRMLACRSFQSRTPAASGGRA